MRAFAGATLAAVACLLSPALAPAADAADLPGIKVSPANSVPECATPGRLMAFLASRNAKLPDRYDALATHYMRHGEELGLRWDYAFFQMLLETGNLTYTGDVKPDQNNFAGLGATGRGARGERFKDISTGVRAHLEHVLMYAGDKVENPVAERTRNIQAWGVLTDWQKTIKGPTTFTHLAKKWAPTSRAYTRDIASVADGFFAGVCKQPDPRPELVAEARKGGDPAGAASVTVAKADAKATTATGKGAEIARKAIAEARDSDDVVIKTGLGGGDLAKAAAATSPVNREAPGPNVKILNQAAPADAVPESAATGLPPESDTARIDTASLTAVAPASGGKAKTEAAKPASNCRVWTASYGGSKAIIIRAATGGATNYTVLDVNEGAEKKEAEAYITAYAKGGETIGEFGTPTQALDKAFELCPEG